MRYSSVEEILFARGMIVTYEAIRKWRRQFEQPYANQLRRRSLSLGIRGILTRYF
jgi:transposase-like protein